MIKKPMPLSVRASVICLVLLASVACQNGKTSKSVRPNAENQQQPSEDALRKQREAERLQLCQQELGALRAINQQQHQQLKQGFDHLMSGASLYAGVRTKVNGDTQEMVDALYRYKVNRLCAEVDQAVLAGLADRAEQVK
ncbi:hypothetical protein [Serratia odorifera]|jgi:hypothetical protein|uniref:Uncharacterized protein n=2 Tax=Serratia odorifera TaxID=618 RepID=D4DZV5_SEROD|nr:hypothetical protein [Serratia odorifera]EFE96861.1 hypothetical protein HMPREF0758_1455 [Serratia odorifera DSM 4582]MBJ2066248.1 hypothetical protein [Serratia odorifera]PNK91448.1 hypothetical protein CEQ31_018080 [Serratia odorifera]RII72463.1 hypothetical protein DX901_08350 [Serratia odorifera]VDZ55746.1 Uncharacterised protein [Serratia odorifera]